MKTFFALLLSIVFVNTSLAATYEVPVAEGLKEFAKFKLSDFEKRIEGNTIFIKYKLPRLLTGTRQNIELQGLLPTDGKNLLLVGDLGVATCVGTYTAISTCTVEYNDLSFDQEKAEKEIRAISKSETEVGARLDVMKSFSTDPVGIIIY